MRPRGERGPQRVLHRATLQSLWQGRAPAEPPAPAGPARYPGFEQSLAVLCAESPNPASSGRYPALEGRAVKQAGALARWWVWANEPCTARPVRAAAPVHGPVEWTTGHPALVVNAVHDPSPRYRAGQAMTAELAGARPLTLDGYGHTALDSPSACVKRHVVRYVLTGAPPPEGAQCRQDTPPFGTARERPAGAASVRARRAGGTPHPSRSGRRGRRGRFPARPGWTSAVMPGGS
ncbi:alpha/beta hydrolase [Streptomyces sp. NPDC006463]|uniref:alpha/beta hydrolase n=1 Tax=Streptomyces sp. NPDC006463 TaxID=3364746 RepID=UPI003675F3D0